jgi:hypothetical protein
LAVPPEGGGVSGLAKRTRFGRYILIRRGWPWRHWYAVWDTHAEMLRATFAGPGALGRALDAIEDARRIELESARREVVDG